MPASPHDDPFYASPDFVNPFTFSSNPSNPHKHSVDRKRDETADDSLELGSTRNPLDTFDLAPTRPPIASLKPLSATTVELPVRFHFVRFVLVAMIVNYFLQDNSGARHFFGDCPEDVMYCILTFLDARSLCTTAQVDRTFYHVSVNQTEVRLLTHGSRRAFLNALLPGLAQSRASRLREPQPLCAPEPCIVVC